jgi:hypothetical protein
VGWLAQIERDFGGELELTTAARAGLDQQQPVHPDRLEL